MATNRRIFVGNLPTDINEDDIRHEFSAYGNVTNVEIKQKKDNLNEGQANTFAFINMDIDTWSLNKCIQEFSEQEWKGKFLKVALAKESFLEQLQRERLEAKLLSKKLNKSIEKNDEIIEQPIQQLSKTLPVPVKQNKTTIVKEGQDSESSESSSSSSDSEPEQGKSEKPRNDKKTVDSVDDPVDDNSFIIKSNKHNSFLNPEKLKIPTYGPAIVSQNNVPHKKNLTPQSTLAEQKRIQSLQEKKEQYNKQKMLLQKSFLKIDVTPKNKIVFVMIIWRIIMM
ncbi:uncharacterized RNA-binding protein P16F5.06-like [Ctenocephalides felis]|uniref:uncharacterized RNA-binding protein P16F5.06-like n=1 Tax=Ctenocephalides felis TaxID=7515 RepID=UPI000E6E4D2D|nr:uncharacterized RNA-binding protein P16F5.06-like [Ctenocephalides felis]